MSVDVDLLRQFVPFNGMSQRVLAELASQGEVVTLSNGEVIFRQGEDDPWLYFLLRGTVLIQQRGHAPSHILSGSETARYALARNRPRPFSAVAETALRMIRIDEHLLEARLGLDQATAYEVFEYEGSVDPDWMLQVLANPTFRNVPPAHANAMFERFQPQACKAGEVIIRQGEPADHYYLIHTGTAQVTRAAKDGTPLVLAELGPGDGFGEEALLTGDRRNASVTMTTDGSLMSLSKPDFDALLKAPLVKTVDLEETHRLLLAGAQLIDVRLEDEYRGGTLRDSLNLPLYLLRLKAASLDPSRKYILFCQHEQRSSAAAFLLAQRGLDAYVLRGGLAAHQPHETGAAEHPVHDAH